MSSLFSSEHESHAHSLQTLNTLYEYDDFMESVSSVVDLGCGAEGLDIEWWATRTTRDDIPQPLNIRCVAMDQISTCRSAHKYKNITYENHDFEQPVTIKKGYDVLWCHDAFQYALNPLDTLANWWHMTADSGMLALMVPQTTNLDHMTMAYDQRNYAYYNHTMVSLMHMLSVSGWDCAGGHFKKEPDDPWLHALVYKSKQPPRDPKTTSWYDLSDAGLLPESAMKSIFRHGYLRQQDLVLSWIDKSLTWMGKQ
jgi:hypothetical protein